MNHDCIHSGACIRVLGYLHLGGEDVCTGCEYCMRESMRADLFTFSDMMEYAAAVQEDKVPFAVGLTIGEVMTRIYRIKQESV